MSQSNRSENCQMKSWGMAAVLGLLSYLVLRGGGEGFGPALFLAIMAFVMLGFLFTWLFCATVPKSEAALEQASGAAGHGSGHGSGHGAQGAEHASDHAEVTAAALASAATVPAATKADTATAPEETSTPAPEAETAEEPAPTATTSTAERDSLVKPSTPLAGEAELAERKGTWKYNAEATDAAAAETAKSDAATSDVGTSGDAPVADTGATAPADAGASESDAENNDTSGGADTATPEPERAATTETVIKPSTPLTGEAELAARKGSWKYEAGGPAAGAAASSSEGGEDFDEDGILEGLDEGSKPALLDAPEGGKADNLKEIKGIGPKLEKACNAMGVYHFHQIAAWSDEEVAWVNANLIGFKGRVTRDKWVEQAKILAEGGETEFSKRVEEGGVY